MSRWPRRHGPGPLGAQLAVLAAALLSASACSLLPGGGQATTPSQRPDAAGPRVRPSPLAAAPAPSPSAAALQSRLSGEYVVTANEADHSLSVVPVGLAQVAETVPLDIAPRGVAALPNSDRAVVTDAAPGSQTLALVSLNADHEVAKLDMGGQTGSVVAPSGNAHGPLIVVSDASNTVRSLDPATRVFGPPVELGAGPHAVAPAIGPAGAGGQVYVANAGDGTISVIDANVRDIQANLAVGGRPVGVVPAPQGGLWVADGETGTVTRVDPSAGQAQQTIQVGPQLTGMAATPDGHYLVLSSSDPDHALYSVDLWLIRAGQTSNVLHSLAVSSGVLAIATGVEVTLVYATTADNRLVYWDLLSNTLTETVQVGRNPVALALSLVIPGGAAPGAQAIGTPWAETTPNAASGGADANPTTGPASDGSVGSGGAATAGTPGTAGQTGTGTGGRSRPGGGSRNGTPGPSGTEPTTGGTPTGAGGGRARGSGGAGASGTAVSTQTGGP